MFIFPRKKFQGHFIRDGPSDCIGIGNSSGWITNDKFFIFMQHFIKHIKPCKESPVLLVLDNHSSHLSMPTLDLAKEKGVVMLSFPPHCSHKLQPLDVSVYGPFKRYLSSAQDAWMRNNAGKTMTIYDIPGIVRTALPLALTQSNIISGFEKTGIFPYNQDKFDDADFAPSYVTDRPMPSTDNEPRPSTSLDPQLLTSDDPQPLTSFDSGLQLTAEQLAFSPEAVRPLPKAGARKTSTMRKRRKAAILTDTPEKENLREEQINKKKKVKKTAEKSKANIKTKQVKKRILQEESNNSSSDEECFCLVCCEKYSDSFPGEGWIQCSFCKQWAHENCVPNRGQNVYFVCNNCDSDNETD